MKNWLAAGALMAATHMAEAGEVHKDHQDHQHEKIFHTEAKGAIVAAVDATIENGRAQVSGELSRLVGEFGMTVGKPDRNCQASVAMDLAPLITEEKFELEQLAFGCSMENFTFEVGRWVTVLPFTLYIPPEGTLGIGQPSWTGLGPHVDESIRLTGKFWDNKMELRIGASEESEELEFKKAPIMNLGIKLMPTEELKFSAATDLGKERQTGEVYVEYQGKHWFFREDAYISNIKSEGEEAEKGMHMGARLQLGYKVAGKGPIEVEPFIWTSVSNNPSGWAVENQAGIWVHPTNTPINMQAALDFTGPNLEEIVPGVRVDVEIVLATHGHHPNTQLSDSTLHTPQSQDGSAHTDSEGASDTHHTDDPTGDGAESADAAPHGVGQSGDAE